ncbi:MAG: hypothetical protein HY810_03875 [Candidatus Omnitrophica bacterium]|nr:hypothetical protein [Candidatus Omnitrophota bacterium]
MKNKVQCGVCYEPIFTGFGFSYAPVLECCETAQKKMHRKNTAKAKK